ncbi:MAG: flagellar hook-basal body complex protein [Planctomycetaceae bacterium]|nr:flagellar hook-basal body complex protein [Planctomycetaceae bacterium]
MKTVSRLLANLIGLNPRRSRGIRKPSLHSTESLEVRQLLSAEDYLIQTKQLFDLGIGGDGFFVVEDSSGLIFSRRGSFTLDEDGRMVLWTGENSEAYLRRILPPQEVIEPMSFQSSGDDRIYIPIGIGGGGEATTWISLDGLLPSPADRTQAQTLRTEFPLLKAAGGVAGATTLLNELAMSTTPFVSGDQIAILEWNHFGRSSFEYLDVDESTTVQHLLDALNKPYLSPRFSLRDGYLYAVDRFTGPSSLSVVLRNLTDNIGSMSFASNKLVRIVTGRKAGEYHTATTIFDDSGEPHTVALDLAKQASGMWNVSAGIDRYDGITLDGSIEGIAFTADGKFEDVFGTGSGDQFLTFQFSGSDAPQTIEVRLDLSVADSDSSENDYAQLIAIESDGRSRGELALTYVDSDGTLYGLYSNGERHRMAQLQLATFPNPDGLFPLGYGTFRATADSGDPVFGAALDSGFGAVREGYLNSPSDPWLPDSTLTRPTLQFLAAENDGETAVLRWEKTTGTASYDVWIQNLSHPERSVLRRQVNIPQLQLDSPYMGSAYRVWVRSINVYGEVSQWSDSRDILLSDIPAMHAVRNAVTSEPTVFEWTSTPLSISYEFWLTDASTGRRLAYQKNLAGNRYVFDAPLPRGTYLTWVRGKRADESFTQWSAVTQFRTKQAPVSMIPQPPTVDATPVVNWSPVPEAESYEVYVAAAGTKRPLYRQTDIRSSHHRISQPLAAGTYDVWNRAHFADGDLSYWGEPIHLEIGTGPRLTLAAQLLTWEAVNGATEYELWIDYNGGEEAARIRLIHLTQYGTNFRLLASLPGGRYTAWVRALRRETGDLYRSRWSTPLVFQI